MSVLWREWLWNMLIWFKNLGCGISILEAWTILSWIHHLSFDITFIYRTVGPIILLVHQIVYVHLLFIQILKWLFLILTSISSKCICSYRLSSSILNRGISLSVIWCTLLLPVYNLSILCWWNPWVLNLSISQVLSYNGLTVSCIVVLIGAQTTNCSSFILFIL